MLSTVLLVVAHARLFTPPAPNVASQQTFLPVESAMSPLVQQPQVIVEMPVPQGSESYTSGMALGVALVTAGLGAVAGRQAVLFMSGGRKEAPKPQKRGAINTEGRASNRGGPYQTNKSNIQIQRNGFGGFVQKFQTVGGKSKYGMPIFLKNGNVNPAYLAAERADMQAQSKRNTKQAEVKRKTLIKEGKFELADYIKKAIGEVGSGQDYYQSGR